MCGVGSTVLGFVNFFCCFCCFWIYYYLFVPSHTHTPSSSFLFFLLQSWVMFFLAFFSTIFAYVGLTGCSFMVVGAKTDDKSEYLGFGLFNEAYYYENGEKRRGCLPYLEEFKDEYVSDSAFNASRTFSMTTVILETLGIALLITLLLFYRPSPKSRRMLIWNVVRGMFGTAFLTQLFMFSVFASEFCKNYNGVETQCNAGPGASLASFNVFLLLAIFVMSLFAPPPRHPVFMVWDPVLRPPEDDDGGKHRIRTEIYSTAHDPNDSDSNNNMGVEVVAGDTFDMQEETPTPRNYNIDNASSMHEDVIEPSDYGARGVVMSVPSIDNKGAAAARSPVKNYVDNDYKTTESQSTATAVIAADAPSEDMDTAGTTPPLLYKISPTSNISLGNDKPTVFVETQIVPEGKRTIETITHPDGSRTVTTTLERFSDSDDGANVKGDDDDVVDV